MKSHWPAIELRTSIWHVKTHGLIYLCVMNLEQQSDAVKKRGKVHSFKGLKTQEKKPLHTKYTMCPSIYPYVSIYLKRIYNICFSLKPPLVSLLYSFVKALQKLMDMILKTMLQLFSEHRCWTMTDGQVHSKYKHQESKVSINIQHFFSFFFQMHLHKSWVSERPSVSGLDFNSSCDVWMVSAF